MQASKSGVDVDDLDKLEEYNEAQQQLEAKRRQAEEARRASEPDVESCLECDEPLPELRKQMHCKLCVDCKAAQERAQRAFARRG